GRPASLARARSSLRDGRGPRPSAKRAREGNRLNLAGRTPPGGGRRPRQLLRRGWSFVEPAAGPRTLASNLARARPPYRGSLSASDGGGTGRPPRRGAGAGADARRSCRGGEAASGTGASGAAASDP